MRVIKLALSFIGLGLILWLALAGIGTVPALGNLLNPFSGFWANAEPVNFQWEGSYAHPSLTGRVKVLFDERWVPHIYADSETDAYFVQGFVTAQMRLWQMDLQVRAAAGRLSEVVGERALNRDREMRRLGLVYGAQKALTALLADSSSAKVIYAYTSGVNAYIEQLKPAQYPLEYKLLNYSPEPWEPIKTALLLKYMGNILTGNEYDIEYTNAINMLGEKEFNLLFPDFPDTLLDPVVPVKTPFQRSASANNFSAVLKTNAFAGPLPQIFHEKSPPDVGSNNWAVDASKSENGKPILCNDMHLSLNLPSLWFEVHINAPGLDVYGVTLPGAPGVIVGFNDSIAWGLTNAAMDVKDWYEVRYRDASKKEYLEKGVWTPTRMELETIKVKGKPDFIDTIYYTSVGPVVYDRQFNKGKETVNLALKWTLHLPSNELKTFLLLNKATNYGDYAEAITHFKNPGQNFVFAAASGDIALWHQGLFVNRAPGQGRLVMDINDSLHHWQGFIPQQDLPHSFNPSRGFVSSANQHPTDPSYPYYYTGIYEYFRNRRINQLLSEKSKFTITDMQLMQSDNKALYAEEVLPILLDHIDRSTLEGPHREAYDLLKHWDFFYHRDALAPSLFDWWWEQLRIILWDEFISTDRLLPIPNYFQTIRYLQKFPTGNLIDIQETPQKETLNDLVNSSFQYMVAFWQEHLKNNGNDQWGAVKNTTLRHLSQLDAFSISGVNIGGNAGIINACRGNYGPSWRMVVSPGSEAYGVYPGGQSGNPGSRHYDGFVQHWANGKYYPLIKKSASEINAIKVSEQRFSKK